MAKIRCTRCNELLNGKGIIYLELSMTDGKYYKELPSDHESQGGFPFGIHCGIKEHNKTMYGEISK